MTIRAVLIAIPIVVLGWLGTLVTISLLTDAAPASVVLFPDQEFINRLTPDMAVLSANRWSLILTSDEPDFARRLYRNGALVVLPAGLVGCIPLGDLKKS